MVKKLGFYVCMVAIMLLCTYSIYLMYETDAKYEVSIDKGNIQIDNLDDVIYTVERGAVEKTLDVKGTVQPMYGEERLAVYIEGKLEDILKQVEIGSILEKGTVYAIYKGKEYKAESRLCCISIEELEAGVKFEFIDYSRLYIQFGIPEKYIEDVAYNQELLLNNNETEFKGKLSFLDAYCVNGLVNAKAAYENEQYILRPGSQCDIHIMLQQKENVVTVPLEFVIYLDYEDEYRIMLVNGDKTITKPVKIGVIGDDMVEIVSGLNENDRIMIPKDEMSLRYYLNNNQEK